MKNIKNFCELFTLKIMRQFTMLFLIEILRRRKEMNIDFEKYYIKLYLKVNKNKLNCLLK